jgi:hypothetical protein
MTLCIISQISVHTADVKQVLRVYSIEVPAREKDDLKEDPIVMKLRKVSGLINSRAGVIHRSHTLILSGRWS